MAFVVLREGAESDPMSIIRHCESRLAYFAVPRFLDFVAELPPTEVGRVKKYVLRERGVTETTWRTARPRDTSSGAERVGKSGRPKRHDDLSTAGESLEHDHRARDRNVL